MSTPQPRRFGPAALCLALILAAPTGHAGGEVSRGQLLYVPVYSEVPYGDKGLTLNLTATLSIRNTDRTSAVTVKRVDYFSAAGTRLRSYLKQAERLEPMASAEHIVRESDRSGGISASFLVEWESGSPVSAPLVEAIMVNSTYNQGVAFSSPARVLEEKR